MAPESIIQGNEEEVVEILACIPVLAKEEEEVELGAMVEEEEEP